MCTMTWHTVTLAPERLEGMLDAIRSAGGTVTHCWSAAGSVHLTWTCPDGRR
jgi:hypothetical protein